MNVLCERLTVEEKSLIMKRIRSNPEESIQSAQSPSNLPVTQKCASSFYQRQVEAIKRQQERA